MRILLTGKNLVPEQGGGYTVSQDVLQALFRNAKNYTHEFFLLDSAFATSRTVELTRNFTRIEIHITRSFFRRLIERLNYEARRRIKSKGNPSDPPLETPYQQAFRRELMKYHLDCALSLTPLVSSHILPTISTVWDLEHRRKPYFPELAANGIWERRERYYQPFLPKAIAVITGTQVGKSQLERFYGLDPQAIKVIPFPTPSFAHEHARRPECSNDELPAGISGEYLFYPAQFWPHKNHIRLLQVLKCLHERHNWKGSLVFCGSDKGNLGYVKERAADLGVLSRTHFLGFVKQSELVALYRNALALTFVSYLGPDNLPPLEAFALGCPVIASAIEGAEEGLDGAALFADPDSVSEIVAGVLRLKNESGLRKSLIAAGRFRASQSTPEIYVGRLMELLDSLELRFECFRTLSGPSATKPL